MANGSLCPEGSLDPTKLLALAEKADFFSVQVEIYKRARNYQKVKAPPRARTHRSTRRHAHTHTHTHSHTRARAHAHTLRANGARYRVPQQSGRCRAMRWFDRRSKRGCATRTGMARSSRISPS